VIHKEKEKEGKIMKKYLSCVILILLCLVCAMIFYANAQEFSPPNDTENTGGDSGNKVPDDNANIADSDVSTEIKNATIAKEGTIKSEYLTDTSLRIEWAIYKLESENTLYLSAELYLDSPNPISSSKSGFLSINGEEKEFTVEKVVGTSTLLTTYAKSLEFKEEQNISIEAVLNVDISTVSGINVSSISASGIIVATENYLKMPQSYVIDISHISQFPELPTGDEITSLAMVLKYLGYDVDKCDLCDLYLDKGPVGFTNFFKANVGNPRSAYNSYGCYAPVIVNAAKKYIAANGGTHNVYDYTGLNMDELLRQVSLGNPVIVWGCNDFDISPSISRIWVIDGEKIYLKSNTGCMVLCGYDFTNNTVKLSNPAGTVFDIDIDLFSERFAQMGSYAVVVK
jgi:uncharacterized protein YvpB